MIKGQVIRIFPKDANTDEIIAGKYKYDELDTKKLASHTFESIDPTFYEDAKKIKNPIIVADSNFGCGSSREQAPLVIKACQVPCIIAESFARIFYRNGFNIGLPLIECSGVASKVRRGDELEVDFDRGIIRNITKSEEYKFQPIPKFMQDLVDASGLMPYLNAKGGFSEQE
ncbi:MAG TPA: 3-isopropylmalate dehydratase [Methanocellales archaeon]|nr:3-isopropylmalate dehydratase [Methanocellales archaeon]